VHARRAGQLRQDPGLAREIPVEQRRRPDGAQRAVQDAREV
jgi:hypothetical protein